MKLTLIIFLLLLLGINFARARGQITNFGSSADEIPDNARQLLVVDYKSGVKGVLSLYERKSEKYGWHKAWRMFSIPVVVGKNGMAKVGMKVEGDGKTPMGAFALGSAFGTMQLNLKMDYRYITPNDKYIDDPKSPQYNTWVVGETNALHYEDMYKLRNLYKLGVIVNYNMNPVLPGKGSAIFLHIWRNSGSGSDGCIAMSYFNMKKVLEWLDKSKNPYILIK